MNALNCVSQKQNALQKYVIFSTISFSAISYVIHIISSANYFRLSPQLRKTTMFIVTFINVLLKLNYIVIVEVCDLIAFNLMNEYNNICMWVCLCSYLNGWLNHTVFQIIGHFCYRPFRCTVTNTYVVWWANYNERMNFSFIQNVLRGTLVRLVQTDSYFEWFYYVVRWKPVDVSQLGDRST